MAGMRLNRRVRRRWGPYSAGAGGSAIAQNAFQMYRKYRTGQKKKTKSANFSMTTQHDSRLVYKKRRMPRRKRRVWRSFKRKAQYVSNTQNPRNTIVKTNYITGSCSVNQQMVVTLSLYPGYNASDNALDDIRDCQALANQTFSDGQAQTTNQFFRSGFMEATIVNTKATTVYMDAYWCYAKKDSIITPQTILSNGFKSTTQAADGDNLPTAVGSAVTENTLGITPFQSSEFCQHFSIWKKTRYILGQGQTVQLEWRDPKNRFLNPDSKFITGDWTVLRGWTKTLVLIFYTVPSKVDTTTYKSLNLDNDDIRITRNANYVFNLVDAGANRYIGEF